MTLEGQTLGEFEILERLGQGGMGAVYKARQLSLKRLVALKTLQPAVADDEAYIARFQQEAIAAAGLSHPNLVQVYSAGQSEGLHWFSMEYVEGESARARLKREVRIDPREATAIALGVATALQYGWRKASLIHRDIKPDNIFLSRDGEVKLGDLGLAKNAGETKGLTSTGHSVGTPYYISPEQAEDSRSVDFRADIYSLGCTLFHMIAGTPPFNGPSIATIMLKHITAPVPVLQEACPQCPPLLSDVVGKMMRKNPADRQQDYETLIGDLRHASTPGGAHSAPADVVQASSLHSPPAAGRMPAPQSAPAPGQHGPVRDRHATYEIDMDLEASNVTAPASAPKRETAPPPGSDPRRAPTLDSVPETPTISTPCPGVAPRSGSEAGATPQSQTGPAGTGELRLETSFEVGREALASAGSAPIPSWVPAEKPTEPGTPQKSLPLGKIAAALLVIAALAYFFYVHHHGRTPSTADSDGPADIPNPNAIWRDWVVESRRDGYFLYHREFVDHKTDVLFQRRAVANSNGTFRNGKMRVRCIIPAANTPAQYTQFYVRMAPDAKGAVRRYEAYFTRNSIVFALNDSAQGVHEITHWPVEPTPDLPIDIVMEIEAHKNTVTVLLDHRLIGTVRDDTINNAGTCGVDGPEETHLTTLSFVDLDPPPAASQPPATSPTAK